MGFQIGGIYIVNNSYSFIVTRLQFNNKPYFYYIDNITASTISEVKSVVSFNQYKNIILLTTIFKGEL